MKKDKEETNENDDDNKQQKSADARKVHDCGRNSKREKF